MDSKFAVSIRTPVTTEAGALARIHLAAFKDDRCVRLMYSDPNYFKAVNTIVEDRCNHGDYTLKAAVTEDGERIVGWLCCRLMDPKVPAKDDLACLEWNVAAARIVDIVEQRLTKSSGTPEDPAAYERRQEMSRILSTASGEALALSLNTKSDNRYLIINTLVTDPPFAFPPYGTDSVGSQLLGWATGYADSEGIAIWAQVSGNACGMFKTAGFEDVHSLALDLDGFYYGKATRGKHVWGLYEVKYMVRKARDRSNVRQ